MLLSVVVSTIFDQAPAGGAPEVFPIERFPLQRARDLFERRRFRHALEAERMLRGRFPERLADVERTGLLGRDALTPSNTADYYYVRRGKGVLLLSPER
jgi:hypothetical protein